jgi:putative aldouronate transport system permease protein
MWPVGFTVDAYKKTLLNPNFLRSLVISVERAALGTALTMLLISMAGYALSKDDRVFKGRTFYAWLFVITMLFSGGLIPNYLLVRGIGIANSIWALVLPGAVAVFSLILIINFFRGIPKELEEASLMDGAGHFKTLFFIYLPLSLPSVATLALFSIVGHWNSWFDGLIYMDDFNNYPLATFLQTVIVQQDFSKLDLDMDQLENLSPRTVRASQVFIGALPVLLVYPFLQKYFVKGMTLGSVKE